MVPEQVDENLETFDDFLNAPTQTSLCFVDDDAAVSAHVGVLLVDCIIFLDSMKIYTCLYEYVCRLMDSTINRQTNTVWKDINELKDNDK